MSVHRELDVITVIVTNTHLKHINMEKTKTQMELLIDFIFLDLIYIIVPMM